MKRFRSATTIVLFLIIVVAVYLIYIKPNLYTFFGGEIAFSPLYVSERMDTGEKGLAVVNNQVFTANLEGVEMVDYKKRGAWSKAYHFKDLLFLSDGDYISAVDISGKEAYIFNYNRKMTGEIKTEGEIVYGAMNKNGQLGIISDLGEEQVISIYDNEGKKRAERFTNFNESGYPIFVALSDKNAKVVSSHLSIKNTKMESVLTFFDFSDDGKVLEDRILGHKVFEDEIISKGLFLDDSHIVFIGDDKLYFYEFGKTIELIETVNIDDMAVDVEEIDDSIVVSYRSNPLQAVGEQESRLVAYDEEGQEIWKIDCKEDVDICVDAEYLYLLDGALIRAYKKDKEVWTANMDKDVKLVQFIDDGVYLFVYNDNFEILKVKDL